MGGEKKKGLGGLSPEKKALLKKLIMDLAMEELRKEEEEKQRAKQEFLDNQCQPLEDISSMDLSELKKYAEQLYDYMYDAEDRKYDLEVKLRKQDFEINQLTIQVNDIRGKFVKPVLRKVNKTEDKLQKLKEFRKKKTHAEE